MSPYYVKYNTGLIDFKSPYVTPELNNELQCNVGKIYLVFICTENRVT